MKKCSILDSDFRRIFEILTLLPNLLRTEKRPWLQLGPMVGRGGLCSPQTPLPALNSQVRKAQSGGKVKNTALGLP